MAGGERTSHGCIGCILWVYPAIFENNNKQDNTNGDTKKNQSKKEERSVQNNSRYVLTKNEETIEKDGYVIIVLSFRIVFSKNRRWWGEFEKSPRHFRFRLIICAPFRTSVAKTLLYSRIGNSNHRIKKMRLGEF